VGALLPAIAVYCESDCYGTYQMNESSTYISLLHYYPGTYCTVCGCNLVAESKLDDLSALIRTSASWQGRINFINSSLEHICTIC